MTGGGGDGDSGGQHLVVCLRDTMTFVHSPANFNYCSIELHDCKTCLTK